MTDKKPTAEILQFKPRPPQEETQEYVNDFLESIKYHLFELPPDQFYKIRDWMNSFLIKF